MVEVGQVDGEGRRCGGELARRETKTVDSHNCMHNTKKGGEGDHDLENRETRKKGVG